MNKPQADWTAIPIRELNLSTRAFNAITRGAACWTLGDIASKSDLQLRHSPGMGPMSLNECRQALRAFLTERGIMGDVANTLIRAVREGSGHNITQTQAVAVISELTTDGWELRRVG